ncbi:MAG: glycosyltransferase family 2 protein [Verrucomicrobiales bacterium]|nr:glycosyltransferase family 2 protein [Verrucomicrobiales bacterium]
MSNPSPRFAPYVLVTPAKNEEALIPHTLDSVIRQTVRPAQWVIVSDGSTDRTDELVRAAAAANPWITLVCLPPRAGRNFAAVVHATERGLQALTVAHHEFIGLLDSDVRFDPDYFERVLETFASQPRLGLAGGRVVDVGHPKDRIPRNVEDIPGATQFFRRACFEALGGLVAIPEGGWDALTCARARMCGYETRLLTHLVMDHLKPRNVSEGGVLRRHWHMGARDCALGYHPLFEALKCVDRLRESPPVLGAMARGLGFLWASARHGCRHVPEPLKRFVRQEQLRRLRLMFRLPPGPLPQAQSCAQGSAGQP